MSEERQQIAWLQSREEEPRTPEPQPPSKDDHDLLTIRVAHNFRSSSRSWNRRPGRYDISEFNEDMGDSLSVSTDPMNLDLMLPVLEEVEADVAPSTPTEPSNTLRPIRYIPSSNHRQFCQTFLPSLRHFHSGSDPRSVIPHHHNNHHEDNPQADPVPESLCVPDISPMEGVNDQDDWGCYSVRLLPKRRRT